MYATVEANKQTETLERRRRDLSRVNEWKRKGQIILTLELMKISSFLKLHSLPITLVGYILEWVEMKCLEDLFFIL